MEFTELQYYGAVGMAIAIGTLVLTVQKILKNIKKDRDEHAAKILQAAKEEDSLIRVKLEARIERLGAEVKNLEFSVNKDMTHLKDTYTSEIKNLGEKIETLRDELRQQHSGLIELLTKIVGRK